jgi:hypothetical protein
MTRENSRIRSMIRSFGTIIEALIIFIVLVSGVVIAVIGKISGLIEPGLFLFAVSVGVEIAGIILVGFYFYYRSFRRSEIASD